KPGRRVRLGATVEEALRHRVRTLDGGLLTMCEVPLQLADREAVERRLELLVDDLLIGVIRTVDRAWEYQPQSPRGHRAEERRVGLDEGAEFVGPGHGR